MIFALHATQRKLLVFSAEDDAITHAENIDLQAPSWQFFDASGAPLEVVSAADHPRCFFVAPETLYLRAADGSAALAQRLGEVATVQGPPPLDTLAGVSDWLGQAP